MSSILIIKPLFKERIWGGTNLKNKFGYELESDNIGECWAISALENNSGVIANGEFAGQTLRDLYKNHRELFNNSNIEEFPLLVKFLDAVTDLSVQVHPNDEYALKNHNCYGKTECWYVLDCKENNTVVYGHNAKNREELKQMINNKEWNKLLKEQVIKPGDFVYVPSGKIHALKGGTMVIEVQQSSDITYRVYDYDRKDKDGNLRELHLDRSIDVTTVPDSQIENNFVVSQFGKSKISFLLDEEVFKVEKWDIEGNYKRKNPGYVLVSILEGKGKINNEEVSIGMHLIVTSLDKEIECEGSFSALISYV